MCLFRFWFSISYSLATLSVFNQYNHFRGETILSLWTIVPLSTAPAPQTSVTNAFWGHHSNLEGMFFTVSLILMIQSNRKFTHDMTALLSWRVQNCDLMWPLLLMWHWKLLQQKLYFELINFSWNGSQNFLSLVHNGGNISDNNFKYIFLKLQAYKFFS